jgi:ABC-type sugar transport system ATPase subunit
VLHGINLHIEKGEFIVFVGPSGCGKSTLLRCIAGLEEITGGTLEIDGMVVNDVPPSQRGIAMVFQTYALYPHMTVYDNMAFGLRLAKFSKDEIDRRVQNAANILQLTPYLDRLPKALSGGQRQRVAIGRAIVRDPQVFLFDEPLSNLDAALRLDMRMEIGKLHQDLKASMIYVTHDQIEAMTLADKIVVLKDGLVMQTGAPMDLYHKPANLFVAGFIGSPRMNFLKVEIVASVNGRTKVKSDDTGAVEIATDAAFHAGDTAILGIRPQYLSLAANPAALTPEQAGITGTVQLVERLGTETIINVSLPSGETLIGALDGDQAVATGSTAVLAYDKALAHLFATE